MTGAFASARFSHNVGDGTTVPSPRIIKVAEEKVLSLALKFTEWFEFRGGRFYLCGWVAENWDPATVTRKRPPDNPLDEIQAAT